MAFMNRLNHSKSNACDPSIGICVHPCSSVAIIIVHSHASTANNYPIPEPLPLSPHPTLPQARIPSAQPMPSEKQIAASRANGALSHGLTAEQGRFNSSGNSARHNLLAATIVLEAEITDRFQALLTALMEEHQPRSATQLMLVETMAVARWRQLRVWGVQKSAIDRDMALQNVNVGPPPVLAIFALTNSPEVLLRYEIAFDRQFSRALARLLTLQSQSAA
jgi:hypothetical protein